MQNDYPKFAGRWGKSARSNEPIDLITSGYNPRLVTNHKSIATPGGSTATKETAQYTGEKIVGISVVHKSCLQPVFSTEEAKEFASMRR